GGRVEQVNESGFDADGAQIRDLLRRARRSNDIMPVLHEQLRQASADRSGGPDHEKSHAFYVVLVKVVALDQDTFILLSSSPSCRVVFRLIRERVDDCEAERTG